MSTETKVLLGVVSVVVVMAVFLLSSEVIEQEIAPSPKAVWVAIEVEGEAVARTGQVEIESGTSFRLHAVLQAETWTGKTIYYTEADEIEIDGRSIPAESLRPWDRSNVPRILWFTVEGFTPYLEATTEEQLEEFKFQDHFRADWPRTWSIPGDLRSRSARDLEGGPAAGLPQFGTQRYHVRIEFFGPKSEIIPRLRLQSPRGEILLEEPESFPTVVSTLPGNLGVPSRVFGLTQIEPGPDAQAEFVERLSDWYWREFTFSRLTLLRDLLDTGGVDFEAMSWTEVEVGADWKWGGDGAAPGDLLRVGIRWVVLLQDRGVMGILDHEDLCLDFDKGAKIERVGDVFAGDGLVEWARIDAP